jgi:hypothetical protein
MRGSGAITVTEADAGVAAAFLCFAASLRCDLDGGVASGGVAGTSTDEGR